MGPQNSCAYLPLNTEHKLKCLCIEIIDNFLLANMKSIETREEGFFTVSWYLFPFQRYELSKSQKS